MVNGRRSRTPALLLIAALVWLGPACDWWHDGKTATTPTTAIVEKFSGSLKQQGSVMFTFSISQAGTMDVTLTAMTPTPSAAVGLGIGTPSGDACTLVKSASSVVAGTTAQLSVNQNPGSYCVKVYDTGALTETVTVTVTVSHP